MGEKFALPLSASEIRCVVTTGVSVACSGPTFRFDCPHPITAAALYLDGAGLGDAVLVVTDASTGSVSRILIGAYCRAARGQTPFQSVRETWS